MAAKVKYGVHFDPDSGRWYATRNGKRTWNVYASYRLDGRGIGTPTAVAPEAPDTENGRAELIEGVRGEAIAERNRSGGGTGRGYSCPLTVYREDGRVDVFPKDHHRAGEPWRYRIKRFTSCSMAPFR